LGAAHGPKPGKASRRRRWRHSGSSGGLVVRLWHLPGGGECAREDDYRACV